MPTREWGAVGDGDGGVAEVAGALEPGRWRGGATRTAKMGVDVEVSEFAHIG